MDRPSCVSSAEAFFLRASDPFCKTGRAESLWRDVAGRVPLWERRIVGRQCSKLHGTRVSSPIGQHSAFLKSQHLLEVLLFLSFVLQPKPSLPAPAHSSFLNK